MPTRYACKRDKSKDEKKTISIIFGALNFISEKKIAIETVVFYVIKNIYPSHANSAQIEKYVLLMTANGFNRA